MGNSQYSESFRKQAVEKFLNRGGKSAEDVAKELGVSTFSLYGWAKGMSQVKKSASSIKRSVDKLDVLLSFSSLPQSKQGEYLRSKGLTTDLLELWKKEIQGKLESSSTSARADSGVVKRVKDLEKEVRRKDRALAETAALLVLSKKAEALWGVSSSEE